jgi:AAHS family 4-hydroxybenzoate transporter-like MFS transporter
LPQISPGWTGVQAFVDAQPLTRHHLRIFTLCALCLIFDGFDAQAMGYVAPALRESLHLPAASLGPIFSASLLGMLIGALALGMLADRIGRRPVLIVALAFCGATMGVTAGAHTVQQLLAVRFMTGLGLGTLLPTALAVTSEFSPVRYRATVVMLMSLGFVSGAGVGGALASWVIPVFGWQAVFLLAGGASLLGALALLLLMPESIQFLAATEAAPYERTTRVARALSGDATLSGLNWFNERSTHAAASAGEARLSRLFTQGYALTTFSLWLLNFANLLDLYFLSNWLPTLLKQAGLPLKIAVIASAVLQAGGIPATVALGFWAKRAELRRLLLANFIVGALGMAIIGIAVKSSVPLLFVAIFVSGFCVVGGQSGVNALGAQCYPAGVRSTGMGWASGVGRLGSVAGPIVGGALLALGWGVRPVFFGAALAGALSAVAVLLLSLGARVVHVVGDGSAAVDATEVAWK